MRNGFVYTVDARNSVAQAVAIDRGRIVYVGSDRGVKAYIGRGTKVTNLRGRMAMPGLQDGHIHGLSAGEPTCDLQYRPLSLDELRAELRQCMNDPKQGSTNDVWLLGTNFYIQFMRPKGAGAMLTKADLDAVSTERPILVRSSDAHTTVVNSRALELAGITAATPDPPDGVIRKGPDGNPNGVLEDGASALLAGAIVTAPPPEPVEAVRQQLAVLNRHGITTVYDPGGVDASRLPGLIRGRQSSIVESFRALERRGQLTVRPHVAILASGENAQKFGRTARLIERYRAKVENPRALPRQVLGWRPGIARSLVRQAPRVAPAPSVVLAGAKLFLDGVVQYPAQTAAMLEPYLQNSGTADAPIWAPRTDPGARGELYVDNPLLGRIIARFERSGIQSHVHAIGDRAVRTTLDAIASARRADATIDARPSIAHVETVAAADIPRFAELDAIPVMSYQWAKPGPDSTDTVKPYLGPERWERYEPEGALQRAGARIAFGSDFPVDALSPFFALEVGVLREADWGPEYPEYLGKLNGDPGLTLAQAIRGMTINAAYQMHQDESTGSLERGKAADLIVLDRNVTKIDPDDISGTEVLLTMVGGKIVHRQAPG